MTIYQRQNNHHTIKSTDLQIKECVIPCKRTICDLRQALGGERAVLVREGKGGKQRLVPYGEMLLNNALPSDIRFQHAANFVNLPRIAS
jgi:hypothetical protein